MDSTSIHSDVTFGSCPSRKQKSFIFITSPQASLKSLGVRRRLRLACNSNVVSLPVQVKFQVQVVSLALVTAKPKPYSTVVSRVKHGIAWAFSYLGPVLRLNISLHCAYQVHIYACTPFISHYVELTWKGSSHTSPNPNRPNRSGNASRKPRV